MIDAGILATGTAAFVAVAWGRSFWLSRALLAAWALVMVAGWAGAGVSMTVLVMTSADMAIAIAALVRFTQDRNKRAAQTVGLLSIGIMPAHFIMAASSGRADWVTYISACNAVFVIQCLTAGGWLDGVGRGFAGIWNRDGVLRALRDRERR